MFQAVPGVRTSASVGHGVSTASLAGGHYDYSAVVTNKTVTGRTVWHFMNACGTHEKVYGELKGGYAFDCIPTDPTFPR